MLNKESLEREYITPNANNTNDYDNTNNIIQNAKLIEFKNRLQLFEHKYDVKNKECLEKTLRINELDMK